MTACRARDDRRQAAGGKNVALNVLTRKGRRVVRLCALSDTKGSGGRVVVGRVVMERRVEVLEECRRKEAGRRAEAVGHSACCTITGLSRSQLAQAQPCTTKASCKNEASSFLLTAMRAACVR